MKQDIATYLVDSFIDYAGKEHKLIACALSQTPEDSDHALKVCWVDSEDKALNGANIYHDVYRLVTIGIAVCNPEDNFNEETGKKIAYNKAANIEYAPRIYTTNRGVITKELVDTFLKQQVQFVKENPEKVITGYLKAKADYEALEAAKKEIENLSDEERVTFNLAANGGDLSKYTDLAKVYNKKLRK